MEKIKYSIGNLKIGSDTIIINMDSATDCIADKLGLCDISAKCYAKKAERLYPQVLPYRRKQALIWNRLSASEIASQIIDINRRKRRKLRYLRLNESGDFRHQGDIWKASIIADRLKKSDIKVYTYSHRKDLDYKDLSDNLTINGSGFMIHNNFKSVKIISTRIKCIGDCRTCHICKNRRSAEIQCKIH